MLARLVSVTFREFRSDEEANNVAVERLHKNDVKYRFTLTGYDKQFK